MSFFRAQVRQEGFHLPSPQTSSPHTTPPSPPPPHSPFDSNALFMPHNVSFLPDAFRKFTAHHGSHTPVDFSDELASIIATSPATHHSSSHERSTQSPVPNPSAMNYDDPYRPPTHNIFDISAPTHSSSSHHHSHSSSSSTGFSPSFSLHRPPSSLSFSHQHLSDFSTPHFNSTLPALNSSMRYEPHPGPEHQQSFVYDYRSQQRHTPSPINTATAPTNPSRSRSRSRDIGPTRSTTTTRSRRNNSLSSVSPPPPHSHHRPHPNAILIPGRSSSTSQNQQNQNHNATNNPSINNGVPVSPLSLHSLSSNTSAWFMSSHTPSSSHTTTAGAGEYSLPTPDSITHPFAHSHSHSGMGISPSEVSSIIGGDIGSMGVGSLGSVGVGSLGSTGIGGMSASIGTSLGAGLSNGNGSLAKETNADPVTKQALLAHEKRRRRRESHNAVERRRRDNINEKISELATLIPECMLDPSAPLSSNADDAVKKDEDEGASGVTPTLPNSASPPASGSANGTPTNANSAAENSTIKANKGMILRKSVEYIRYLQQLVSVQAERNRELESQLAGVRDGDPASDGKPKAHGKLNGKRKIEESDEEKMGGVGMQTPESSVGVLTPPKDGDEEREGDISTPDHNRRDNDRRKEISEGGEEGEADGMNGMMLHDGVLGLGREVVGMVEGFGDMEGVGVGQMPYFSHHRFELESMPEDMEVEDEDEDGRFGVDKGFGLGAESEVSTQGEDDGEENSGGLVRGRKRDRERERSRAGVVKEGEAEDMDV